jgi:DNA primase
MSLSQDIESRINILDIVGRYVDMKKAGINYKALCPFHSEKSPSFIISPQKNIAHCFSCGKWGGPLKFLMEIEKIDFREAIQVLAKEAGVELKTDFQKEKADAWWDIYALYRNTAEWYHLALYKDENKKYLDYLKNREMSDETIKKFQLGCSTSPRDLWFYLKEKGFSPQFLIDSGIFISEWRDKFFGRITFPIANSMGHVVAFTGRVLDNALPKYLNSPASHIFDKSSTLYGLHLAKQAISKTGEVYIVEWQMDTITLHQAWVENAVWISGTALTEDQQEQDTKTGEKFLKLWHIGILKRFTKKLYLCLDSDNAGVKATFASIEALANQDIEARIIIIPNGKDPDEFIKSGGDFALLKNSALSPIGFYLMEWGREYDLQSVIGKKKLIEKCLSFLVPIKSQIEIDMHISEISIKLWVSKEAILSEYKKWVYAKNTRSHYNIGDQKDNGSIKKDTFTPSELLAGYIYLYDLLDLFFREFRYTQDDLSREGNFSLLFSVISGNSLDPDDEERLKIISLSLESTHPDEDTAQIQKSCTDLLKNIHTELLIAEKNQALASGKPLLEVQQVFIQKAISLGISPSVLRS